MYLALTAADGEVALVPAVCLATAYRDLDDEGASLLDLLSGLENVVVTPLERDECSLLGGWARVLGLGTAHAAIEAAATMTPLMTRERELVAQFLGPEWPIIDV